MIAQLLRIGSGIRFLWLSLGIALLLVAVMEAGLMAVFNVYDRSTGTVDVRTTADAHGGAPWVSEYYREFHRGRDDMRWTSYVYWRRRPHQSPYINVDDRGIRATWSTAGSGGLKIYMFGGSTLWGTGARDDYTIPSLLAKELKQKGIAATVTNFGESGWVSTQELVALQFELRDGRRPDVVIFYDGINDTWAGFQQGVAGIPQNEFNREQEFNFMKKPVKARLALIARDGAQHLATSRFFRLFMPGAAGQGTSRDEFAPGATKEPAALAQLSRDVIDTYVRNVQYIRALETQYQFKSLFYWQPTVADKPQLTAYEKDRRAEMAVMEPFFRQTNQALRDRHLDRPGPQQVHDLKDVFAATAIPVFVDRFHLAENGNEIVAKRMLPDVLAAVAEHGTPSRLAAASSQR